MLELVLLQPSNLYDRQGFRMKKNCRKIKIAITTPCKLIKKVNSSAERGKTLSPMTPAGSQEGTVDANHIHLHWSS